jgi:hypothetical protein
MVRVQDSQEVKAPAPNTLVQGPQFLTLFGDDAVLTQDLARLAKGETEAMYICRVTMMLTNSVSFPMGFEWCGM